MLSPGLFIGGACPDPTHCRHWLRHAAGPWGCAHNHPRVAIPEPEAPAEVGPASREPRAALAECEAVIERGLATFIEVGRALLRIREERLYRETHGTFEDYCKERWGFSRQTGYDLMQTAQVAELVQEVGQPTREAARELAPFRAEPDAMRELWAESRKRNGPTPTAAQVRATVNGHRPKRTPVNGHDTKRAAPSSGAAAIRHAHEAAALAARSAIEHARRAGELLLEAKAGVPGREWRAWLKRERIPEGAARQYMDRASREGPVSAERCRGHRPLDDGDGRCVHCGRELPA